MTITVYGVSASQYTRKVLVSLEEKGVEYEVEEFTPFTAPDWFSEISPLRKIPVIRDPDIGAANTLPDSSVICDYLERKYPEPSLYPKDDVSRARALWYEEYSDTALTEVTGRPLFFQRIAAPIRGSEPDQAIIADAIENRIPPVLEYLETELADKEFFAGDVYTVADIAIGSSLANYLHAGEILDAGGFQNLSGFAARILTRPAFRTFLTKEAVAISAALPESYSIPDLFRQ